MAWTKVLNSLPPASAAYDLCVFNNKLYALVGGSVGRIFEWNGVASVWSEVVNLATVSAFRSQIVFQSQLYITGYTNAILYRFNNPGVVQIATNPSSATIVYNMAELSNCVYGTVNVNGYIYKWDPLSPSSWSTVFVGGTFYPSYYSIAPFNSKLYLGSNDGKLYEWDPAGPSYNIRASQYGTETVIRALKVYNGELYAFTYPSGYILKWDGVSAWVYVATIPNFSGAWRVIEVNNTLFIIGDPSSGDVIIYSFDGVTVTAETPGNNEIVSGRGLAQFTDNKIYAVGANSGEAALYESGIGFDLSIAPIGIPSLENVPPPSLNYTHIVENPPLHIYRDDIGDIRFVLDANKGYGDVLLDDRDVERDLGFETAVLIILGTDRRAEEDDILPDDGDYQGGYWADELSIVDNDKMGTRIWLLRRSKTIDSIPLDAKNYLIEGYQWMIDDGIVESIDINVVRIDNIFDNPGSSILQIDMEFIKPSKESIYYRFYYNWEAQILRRG